MNSFLELKNSILEQPSPTSPEGLISRRPEKRQCELTDEQMARLVENDFYGKSAEHVIKIMNGKVTRRITSLGGNLIIITQ
jgi:hypothetical protein